MAIGAGAVAFTPARHAILTEGPSDALLLPALLREAMEWSVDRPLGIQVAGGLAWTPPRELASLEGEAGHVVYLTDSDGDGKDYQARLQDAGVAPSRIFSLAGRSKLSLTIEDFVDKSTYVHVINLLLTELQGYRGEPLTVSDIPEERASRAVDAVTHPPRPEAALEDRDRRCAKSSGRCGC